MKQKPVAAASAPPPSTFERVVKRIAGVGVILSLLLGLFQVANLVHGARDRMARVAEMAKVAQIQSARDEPAEAWASLAQAISLTDEAGPPLPVGLQIMAPTMADDRCYRVAAAFETAYLAANGPILQHLPSLGANR